MEKDLIVSTGFYTVYLGTILGLFQSGALDIGGFLLQTGLQTEFKSLGLALSRLKSNWTD